MPPAEILEASYPLMFTEWGLRPDSAGAGAHRGGMGAIYALEVLAESGAEVALLGERGRHAPFGVAGGHPGALNRFHWESETGLQTPPMASKITGVKIAPGQEIRLQSPGGAVGATRRAGRRRLWLAM